MAQLHVNAGVAADQLHRIAKTPDTAAQFVEAFAARLDGMAGRHTPPGGWVPSVAPGRILAHVIGAANEADEYAKTANA